MTELEKFIQGCQTIEQLVYVTAHEPTPLQMAQINSAYELDPAPTLFKFCVKDSQGAPQTFEIIVPYAIWSTVPHPPVEELLAAAERCRTVPQTHTFFLLPDRVDSVPLLGHELRPMPVPGFTLNKLLERLRGLACVEGVEAYKIVDPDLLNKAGCSDAVVIKIDVEDLTRARMDQIGDVDDDEIQLVIGRSSYDNEENHDNIIFWATERIAEIIKQ